MADAPSAMLSVAVANSMSWHKAEKAETSRQGASQFHRPAAKVLRKVLYGARMARPDLMKITCTLARAVNRWTPTHAEQLHKMMCYIHQHSEIRFVGWCGDDPSQLSIRGYADADCCQ